MIDTKWSLDNIPPAGHPETASFANELFDIAEAEKRRLDKNNDFLTNYSLYRGKAQVGSIQSIKLLNETPVNIYFSNIERTVANITARQPQGEVVDLDGVDDGAEDILSMVLQKWWKRTNQQEKTKKSARTMEVYGITPEKPYWDKGQGRPDISLQDPFGLFPAPGNWDNISEDAPYVCFAYLQYVSEAESFFEVTDIAAETAYELLGAVREEYKSQSKQMQRIGNYSDNLIPANRGSESEDQKLERCLIKEIWIRDKSTKKEKTEAVQNDEAGNPILDEMGEPILEITTTEVPVYPDGVRKITVTKSKKPGIKNGYIVLDDSANPNINPDLEVELASKTYPWGRLPIYIANSYSDLISPWGFAASEQVGDLLLKINRIISKLVNYVINVMAPPLIVQKHCGISRTMIEESLNKAGRLVLMPTTPNARIEFMQIPNLPSTFFNVLDLIVKFFDRIYATEEADRGQAPSGVIAASAIQSLQERNQVLMQAKINSIDKLIEERSRWCIGLYQNFGTKTELVKVAEEMAPFIGVQYAGRSFSYVISSGSTTPRTSLHIQEMARWLWETKAIGQRGLLEAIHWPNWKEEIERTAESQLDQALQILIDSGLPEEEALKLRDYLMQPDQGPDGENTKKKAE